MAECHYFGIRHHGPGSARQLVAALQRLQPVAVLIEGPADLTELMTQVAAPELVPPVALLAYAVDDPANAAFWPFAEYSPELQAARWALSQQAELQLIDLPAAQILAPEPVVEVETAGTDVKPAV